MILFPPLHVGHPLGFASVASLEDLGLACEGQVGGGAFSWVAGVLEAPGTQGGWLLGQQGKKWSRRVWQPLLANTLLFSCLENSLPQQRSLTGHSLQGRKE